MIKKVFPGLVIGLLCLTTFATAQETEIVYDSAAIVRDSSLIIESTQPILLTTDTLEIVDVVYDSTREKPAARAALYSGVLPGLGQAYNKKYWKIPFIYGGFAFFGYFIEFSHERYIIFRELLLSETDPDPRTENNSNLSEDSLRRRTDQWRRTRDLMVGLTVVLYFLNILDAHIDAHLNDFDVNQNLSLEITPMVDQVAYLPGPVTGISIKLNF